RELLQRRQLDVEFALGHLDRLVRRLADVRLRGRRVLRLALLPEHVDRGKHPEEEDKAREDEDAHPVAAGEVGPAPWSEKRRRQSEADEHGPDDEEADLVTGRETRDERQHGRYSIKSRSTARR